MKKIQTPILIILPLLILLFAFSHSSSAEPAHDPINQADSLFKAKLYTQSFDLYHQLFLDKKYSQATLLKMAFIQEGLGHLSQSLYYLNLYYQASGDEQVLSKVNEVAKKNNLEGYESDQIAPLYKMMKDNFTTIVGALATSAIFCLSIFIYQQKRNGQKLVGLAFLSLFFLGLLFVFLNFSSPPIQGVITTTPVYLMKGPSAGAAVAAIVDEGHRLEIKGHEDVWLKVTWKKEDVFIKKNQILPITLN